MGRDWPVGSRAGKYRLDESNHRETVRSRSEGNKEGK